MFVLNKLFKPLHYAKIKHTEKLWYDFVLPILSASVLSIVIYMMPSISLLSKDGLVSLINGMLQILSGFYIASMAAVATFQRDGMDELMEGVPPKLNGDSLTRRVFLTYLFGYLAFMSISFYFIGGFAKLAAKSIEPLFVYVPWLKEFFLLIYLFFVFNILFTTVLGMHFMIDKIHRVKPTLIDKKKEKS
ncbi:hypothetical protein [Pleionea sp. CnH1-48]|uniref:hypothetical protein n=1 Tax=Pleionea sp. CnH1-48 TaxID=2954494 RepID=UPI0020985572|nr:hypothetical protein [Pleionea sp. CnH1-48]MCO7227565.1 hypothetical protein [Pleionea sp. CnH1-48]